MKKIEVNIKSVFKIPDNWEIVDYDFDDNNPEGSIKAIKTHKNHHHIFSVDFLAEYDGMFKGGGDDFTNDWIERMTSEECKIIELK